MLMQNNGWPLGLGNMNVRFAVAETSVNAAAEAMPYASHRIRSSSSSSISSSNLDTESASSFFPDQSVSLGRLIGIGPGNTGSMHCPNTDTGRQHENLSHPRGSQANTPTDSEMCRLSDVTAPVVWIPPVFRQLKLNTDAAE
ncbi:Uncharacterized protein Adt_36067 [Abeliophyllum distichum]|uniref:Uncharacterized protein n=1 Tax=Abeliophyllum distichum TaxID=126358 RepID=A0ABD1QKC7_9LAMI